ncbi:MAG: DUF6544 family protein [Haloarculaceae archaeon]
MSLKRYLGAAGLALGGVAAAAGVGRARFDRAIARRVDDLLAASRSPAGGPFSAAALSDLPDPVRRYLRTAIEDGRPAVGTVRLEQRGEFRLGGDASAPWKPLTATQHFTTDPPGFVWDARIEVAPRVPVRVVDAYVDGQGSLRAKLLSAVTVAEADPGPEMDDGELLRYLAECVWFPTALLPAAGVEWAPIDDRTARATVEHRGGTASLTFHFDDRDLVERVHAGRRYRQETDAFTPWTGYFEDYVSRGGLRVPTRARVEWNLPDGDLPYWRATVSSIDHQPPA